MFIGTVGGGKTLSMVYEAYKYYKYRGYTVYANFGLRFPHIKLTKEKFDELIGSPDGLQNAVVLIDECHIWLDSRSSMRKKNKMITYFILQTRKRNVRLLATTQHLHQVDKRLRDTVDILVFCKNVSNNTSLVSKEGQTWIQQEYLFQWKEMQRPMKHLLYGNPVFPLFDTTEVVSLAED